MKWLSWDHIYWRIISAAALCARPEDIHPINLNEYTKGFITSVARIFLESLQNQGLVGFYTVKWQDYDLLILIQETAVAEYVVYKFPASLFSEEMMAVAEVMVA